MCGILAVVGSKPMDPAFVGSARWDACMESLGRRGPDGSGQWISGCGHAAMGHTRLAIVDPSERGRQPMVDESERFAITYNGEIYNAPTLRKELEQLGHRFRSTCDTEVLLRGWMQWESGVLDRVHGMYAFAIWDTKTRELFAAIDHAGMKPLVYKRENHRLLIASDCDAMRALTGATESLDMESVGVYLSLGCCPPPRTMWSGIQKLRPGHALRWSVDGSFRIERHWAPPEEMLCEPIDSAAFTELFERVNREHLLSDVPVGVFLSGGLDSASITAAATRNGASPACFSLAMDGPADESEDARRLADRLGLACTIGAADWSIEDELGVYSAAYDEPQSYSALLTQTRISAIASRSVKAVLAGDGGDECFGGYLWQRAGDWTGGRAMSTADVRTIEGEIATPDAADAQRALGAIAMASRGFVQGYVARAMAGFHPSESRALLGLDGSFDADSVCDWLAGEDRAGMDHLRRVQRLDLTGFCAASILPKVDRGAMHFGLEVRSPMLDRRLLDYGLCAPVRPGEMISDGSGSRPDVRGYASCVLGGGFTDRPKQGFSLRRDDELRQWRALCARVDRSWLVRDGVLRADWRSFVPVGAIYRLRSVCMLSVWGGSRV
ncbi:MAG: asparagine synthase (glutamine-hydrolyzing) [Phycisphaerales bacterium]|nr:asparagine synthase (glutamine-hydrolyzing) [Phycisphaerales bacterium]